MTPLIDLESVRTHWRSGHDGADLARRLGELAGRKLKGR